MRNLRIFPLFTVLLILFLTSCKEGPNGPGDECDGNPLCLPPVPPQVGVMAPTASETYWTDQPIPCVTNEPDYADITTWFVGEGDNAEVVGCTDGKLDTNLADGKHKVTARIADEGESVDKTVTITVKEGFSVSLDKPKSGAEYFVGDEVSCSATIEPEKYEEHLVITVGDTDCTNGSAKLTEAGELPVRASAQIDGRTEADEATVVAKPVLAGKVYPLTSDGVQDGAGFTVTLRAGGEVVDAQTDADGNFAIKSDRLSELGGEEVELEVAASGNFYGSRAILPADELLALVESDKLGFILAPKTWHIRDGKLAGSSANLKLRAAFTRVVDNDAGTSFYNLRKVFGEHRYVSVPPNHRPLAEAFNREESSVDITTSDSTDFWQATDDVLESDVGRGNLFSPATLDEVPSVSDGVHVYSLDPDTRSSAGISVDGSGSFIDGGWISLDITNFGDWVQTHEQIHNLSFGHASQWDGIMTAEVFHGPSGERITVSGRKTDMLTVNDVAHIQVYMDAFDLQFEEDISFAVLEWMQALNIESLPETTSSAQKVAGKYAGSHHHETVECRIH